MRIAVVALGKIGLPFTVQFASKGHRTVGVDTPRRRVELVDETEEPFPGEVRLQGLPDEAVTSGGLRITTGHGEAIPDAEVVILVIPLVVDKDSTSDFRQMDAATNSLAERLNADAIASYETTLSINMTRERWKPVIEEISGLEEGGDFHLMFSPKGVLSGRVFIDLRRYPELAGGSNESGTAVSIALYEQFLGFGEYASFPQGNGVWNVGSTEAAELAKLIEAVCCDVNIALASQFAIFVNRAGINIYTVIETCSSQPYNHLYRPRVIVDGHYVPAYPRLYLSSDPDMDVVSTVRAADATIPEYVISELTEFPGDLRDLGTVVFGVACHGGVEKVAFSKVFATVDTLRHRDVLVLTSGLLHTGGELRNLSWVPYHPGNEINAVIIQTGHEEYASPGPANLPSMRILFDGHAISNPVAWESVPCLLVDKGC